VDGPPDRPRSEPRQRWRLVARRSAEAPALSHREVADGWEAAVVASGLPVAFTDAARPRARLSFGAPLPLGIAADAELIDLFLTDRLPVWHVREALSGRLPAGWSLVDLHDVWLAGPPLAGRVVAADYRIVLAGGAHGASMETAARRLLEAPELPRDRPRGAETVRYDLRPLIVELAVDAGPPVVVRARTRFHPELGTGRPEEVLAALAEAAGQPLNTEAIVRERLILADDPDAPGPPGPPTATHD
jgi:radical SAM-linked protein